MPRMRQMLARPGRDGSFRAARRSPPSAGPRFRPVSGVARDRGLVHAVEDGQRLGAAEGVEAPRRVRGEAGRRVRSAFQFVPRDSNPPPSPLPLLRPDPKWPRAEASPTGCGRRCRPAFRRVENRRVSGGVDKRRTPRPGCWRAGRARLRLARTCGRNADAAHCGQKRNQVGRVRRLTPRPHTDSSRCASECGSGRRGSRRSL